MLLMASHVSPLEGRLSGPQNQFECGDEKKIPALNRTLTLTS